MMIKKLSFLLAFALFGGSVQADDPATSPNRTTGLPPVAAVDSYGLTDEQQAEHEAGLQWFRDAKFGVFIHFGLYSVPAGEWKGKPTGMAEWFQLESKMPLAEYAKFAQQLNPTNFDAKEWVKNIKNAGMKYVVITTKHHDGFAMYDTKLEDYNVVQATPWAHDPMKDLAEACKDSGVQLCFYYSLPDWHSPDFPARYSQRGFHGNPNPDADIEKYVTYVKGQIHEILTQYGPIGALWFDDGGAFRGVDRPGLMHSKELLDEVHQLQPRCVVDDRLGIPADYNTPEQRIPTGHPDKLFESCLSLNGHWGYNKNDHNWKSPKTIVQDIVTCASKGGNFILGIGAVADGTFPPTEAMPSLASIGQWLKVNGDSVYGTTASPLKMQPPWGRITQKDDKLYLHVFIWPQDGQLVVPLQNKIKQAYLLADSNQAALSVTPSDHGTMISLPAQAPDSIDTVVVLEIDAPSNLVEVSLDLGKDKPVEVSSTWSGREEELNKSHITDGDAGTHWAAESSARTAWVTVDLQAEHEVSSAMLSDAPFGRTQAFSVEVGGAWKKIAEGTTIGEELHLSFPPVKAQLFRLNILQASDTPALAEFQLYGK
jgi:alpha-L-fucosidase